MKCSHWTVRAAVILMMSLMPLMSEAKETRRGGSAFFKSLIVPGWGQLSLQHKNSALAFFGTELVLVGGMMTLNSYGRTTRADYHALAAAHAGVTGEHDHDFYVDVGNWMSVDDYNEKRLQERNYDALYTSPEDRWQWDSDEHRGQMEKARIRSDRAFNSVIYIIGGMAINHVASAIHAGRLSAPNSKPTSMLSPAGWKVSFSPVVPSSGMRLTFTHSF